MVLREKTIDLEVPDGFSFWTTVGFSGWRELAPYLYVKGSKSLVRFHGLSDGKVVRITAEQGAEDAITLSLESVEELDGNDLEEIRNTMRTSLSMDFDLTSFYDLIEGYPEFSWVAEIGLGRGLRSPTVFEDVVKTICTTNASWGLTKGICRRLCEKLGAQLEEGISTFPTPGALASATEEFLRREVKSGYRSRYLMELGVKIESGELDPEAWWGSDADISSLKTEILAVKGVGEYAANNILQLLGRYDFLALDSWMRKRFSEIYGDGEPVTDDEIEEHYAQFGRWKGLVMNMEMTKEIRLSVSP